MPNLTIGPMVCKALRDYGIEAPIDVHLMVKPVDRIIPDFAKAGATYITFHPEASEHIDRSLQLVRECGCKSGLVFNPATPLSHLDYVLDKVDMILLMSVNPGFGGQSFIPSTLDKSRALKQMIDEKGLMQIFAERDDFKYLSDIAPDCKDDIAAKYEGRFFFTPKKMGAQTAEANINAGIAAAQQIANFINKGDTTFKVN